MPSTNPGTMGWRQRVASPRIEQLRHELHTSPGAVDDFWASVAAIGAPLIETLPGDSQGRCVTFLYRDLHGELEHVALCHNLVFNDFGKNLLTRVGSSDVFALSLRLPANTRTAYVLSPDDPLSSLMVEDVSIADRCHAWQPDALNRSGFAVPVNDWQPEARSDAFSLLELPGSTPVVWSGPPTSGEEPPDIRPLIHDSARTEPRRVWYVRVGEEAPERVIVALDGWDLIHIARFPWVLARLYRSRLIPPVVAALVDCGTSRMRWNDYFGSPKHSDYLANEVVPAVAAYAGVEPDPVKTAIYGLSAGGLTALATAFRHPSVFGNAISQAAPAMLRGDDLPDGIVGEARSAARDRLPRVHLQAGSLEVDNIWGGQILESNRELARSLATAGFDVAFDEEPCAHDYVHFGESVVNALLRLLSRPPSDR
ncbi:MAG: hypothetical protein V7607_5723 [Solirubrobacteraceae bacterium]